MNYEKPKVDVLGPAITAVRGTIGKGLYTHYDNPPATPMTFSVAAYEADE